MTDYLDSLNEEQRNAVTVGDGPVLVIAGAGSGKTRVLTARAAHLIANGVSPGEIMALTFTNKAAGEMRNRLEGLLGYDIYSMWVGTFHRICLRILRMDGDKLGIGRDFVIFDETDQRAVVRSIIKQKGYDDGDLSPSAVLAAIGEAKNGLLDAEAYLETDVTSREEAIADIYAAYEHRLRENNGLDFDDILNRTVELFTLYREVLMDYRQRFPYILVDEYQDTNEAQYRFLRLLGAKTGNLFVVGDPDQSIYGFRGARIENILNFQRDYPGAAVFRLETNYRSTAQILEKANRLIEHNAGRLEKELHAHDKSGKDVSLQVLPDERGEARFIADTISRLRLQRDIHYRQMAVFYRTHAQSRVLEETLSQRRIPYRVYGGVKFYERAEIKDTIAYLRLLVNSDDNISLLRVVNVPRRGIGNVTVEKLEDMSATHNMSIRRVLEQTLDGSEWKAAAGKALRQFVGVLKQLEEYVPTHTVTEIVAELWRVTGYRAALENSGTVEDLSRIENMDEFLTVTKNFDEDALKKGEVRNLADFLADVSLSSDLDDFDADDYLTLMTIHMAKGLEFPIVFMMGMEESLFPHVRSVMSGKESEIEEERRLCYVGITRAMDELYLLRTYKRTLWGKTMNNRASRFLAEMGLSVIRESKPSTTVAATDYDDSFQLGERVRHDKFGEGVIIAMDKANGRAKVAFPDLGIKEFLLAYANLQRADTE